MYCNCILEYNLTPPIGEPEIRLLCECCGECDEDKVSKDNKLTLEEYR